MIDKDILLDEYAEFTWDFAQHFFIETKHGGTWNNVKDGLQPYIWTKE